MKRCILLLIYLLGFGLYAQNNRQEIKLTEPQKLEFAENYSNIDCECIEKTATGYWFYLSDTTVAFIEREYLDSINLSIKPEICSLKKPENLTYFLTETDTIQTNPEEIKTIYSTDCEGWLVLMDLIGETEIVGNQVNYEIDFIIRYSLEVSDITLPKLSINDDVLYWCSAAVIYAESVCNKYSLDDVNLMARSWLDYGEKTLTPEIGDIVILWRESVNSWKGHVGYFLGYSCYNCSDPMVYVLGGNQSNSISVKAMDSNRILAFINTK